MTLHGFNFSVSLPTKLYDHPFLAVRGCLLNIFAVAFHVWTPSSPCAMLCHYKTGRSKEVYWNRLIKRENFRKRLTSQKLCPHSSSTLKPFPVFFVHLRLIALKHSRSWKSFRFFRECVYYLSGATLQLNFIGLPLIEYLPVPISRRVRVCSVWSSVKGGTCSAYSIAVLSVGDYMLGHFIRVSNSLNWKISVCFD